MKLKTESISEIGRVFFYRIFCIMALIVALYFMIDSYVNGSLDIKVVALFFILLLVIIFGILDWMKSYSIQRKQERELRLYKLYIQPLEELTKDIRTRQHAFDNHMNAILNMHVTIDNYEELVRAQNAYAKEISTDKESKYPMLLRISDKILAGFLYSKIISAPAYLNFDVQVLSGEMITGISEHSLIEIVGVLVDNAIEACTKERNTISIVLDGQDDKIAFSIKNPVENLTLTQISHFFERGYTTKANREGHGLGLFQANQLVKKYEGELTVELLEDTPFEQICFRVEV